MGFLSFLFGKKTPPAPQGPTPPSTKPQGQSASWENEGAVPQEMTARELIDLWESPDCPVFLDVRERAELEADGFIPGSIHIPMGELEARHEELDPSLSIVVYCATGMRSMDAGALLISKGFQDVSNLNGGFVAWKGPTDCFGNR